MKIRITSDSTTDLSPELLERYQVALLPLSVSLGEQTFTDGVDITPDDIYANYEKTGTLPKTAAPNPEATEAFFRAQLEAGYDEIVHFTISSEMSSSYANAVIAAEELGHVHVVDTRNLSTGGGLLSKERKAVSPQRSAGVPRRVSSARNPSRFRISSLSPR